VTAARITASTSVPLGALALDGDVRRRCEPEAADVAAVLATTDVPARAREAHATTVASGGTATSLAALALGLVATSRPVCTGTTLEAEGIVALVGAANGSTAIDEGRAAILAAGAASSRVCSPRRTRRASS
jgi:exopolyphosphatase/pppGpp-phosphohydrolase